MREDFYIHGHEKRLLQSLETASFSFKGTLTGGILKSLLQGKYNPPLTGY
jgi:hypothetical protein